jgi:hypothetical protein
MSVHLLVDLLFVETFNCGLNLHELESSLVNASLLLIILDFTFEQQRVRTNFGINILINLNLNKFL